MYIRDMVGFALFQTRIGGKHIDTKLLKDFGGTCVL